MNQGSLVRRLIFLAAGWSLALLAATAIGLSTLFYLSALTEFQQGLSEDVDSLYSGSQVTADGEIFAPAITDARATRAYSGKYWELAEVGPDGLLHVINDQRSQSLYDSQRRSRSLFDQDMPSPPNTAKLVADAKGKLFFYNAQGPLNQKLYIAARQVRFPGYAKPVVLLVGQDRGHIDDDVRHFALITAAALLVLGIGLLVAVVLQVRVGLVPLFNMGREIAAVRTGQRSRLSERYPLEIAPLAQELNKLLDHNQEVVERQRTHVGNLAHALKTPISVMQAEAEVHPGALAEVVGRQSAAMQAHVEHHLRRARAAARSTTSGERTSVAEVLDDLARMLERVHPDGEIEWDADEELYFLGERQDFQEIAGNLMENACKWRKRRVRVAAGPEAAGRFKLTVEDDGPGLPEAARASALKRGQRLDESTPGSGLGLSIVSELASAYGGSVTLDSSRLGGLKVEVELPQAG